LKEKTYNAKLGLSKATQSENKKMKLTIDRFTVVALCITAVTGIAINKFDIIQAVVSYMF